jgi:predicted AlkP superfamily phosphohydrolase/phosphomutase
VNGFLVGGMLTPSTHSSFTYPDSLKYELDNVCHGYEIDIEPSVAFGDQVKYDLLVNDLKRILAKRLKATLFLLTNYEWDFFMIVFTEPDRIQHFLWGFNDPRHPNYTRPEAAKYRQLLQDFFVHVDKVIDTIVRSIPDCTNVFIVSDHGFAGEHTRVYMPNWLSQKGLFSLPPKLGTDHARRNPHSWLTTKAYPGAASSKSIYINLKGREPNGVVEPGTEYNALRSFIMEELANLTDPRTNKRVVKRIVKREDVYWGEYVEFAPDLLVETDGYALSSRIGKCGVFEPLEVRSGGHAKDGLFIAWGPAIQKSENIIHHDKVKIVDIAPTVLHLLGVSPPHTLDGNVIPEVANI